MDEVIYDLDSVQPFTMHQAISTPKTTVADRAARAQKASASPDDCIVEIHPEQNVPFVPTLRKRTLSQSSTASATSTASAYPVVNEETSIETLLANLRAMVNGYTGGTSNNPAKRYYFPATKLAAANSLLDELEKKIKTQQPQEPVHNRVHSEELAHTGVQTSPPHKRVQIPVPPAPLPSYAQVAANNSKKLHTILLYPKEGQENPLPIRNLLQTELNQRKEGIKIAATRTIRKNGLAIDCTTRTKAANDLLHTNIKEIQPDIIAIQDPYTQDHKLNGFPTRWNSYTSNNLKAAILIPNAFLRTVLISKRTNTVAIKIQLRNFPLTIISAYSSPTENIQLTLQEITEILASLQNENILLGADLNGHNTLWGYKENDTRGNNILDFILANELFLLNNPYGPPTYTRNQNQWWPDLTLLSSRIATLNPYREVLETPSLSDHKYILTTLTATSTNSMYRRYKTLHGNHKKFLNFLSPQIEQISNQISNISSQQHLNDTTKDLQQLIINACNHAYKKKQVNFIPTPNWWNQALEVEKKRLRALRRRAQRATSNERQARFIQESKEKAIYKKKVKHARTSGWHQFCTAATNPYGKHYKAAFRKGVFPSQLAVLANSQPTDSLTTIANNFMDDMFPQPDYTVDYSLQQTLTQDDPLFTKQEVTYAVKHLPAGKATGVDGIDNLVIKIIHNKFPHLLTSLYNKCLTLGSFPDTFKIGNIVFFQKQGKDPSLSSSYRPISLLPAMGKVLERLLTQRLTYHLEQTGYISERQFGFREGYSVDTALDSLLTKIKEARSTAKHSIVLSIDIKGAFDNLHHEAIMKALSSSQSPANITKVFNNLLQNRKVTVQTPTGPIVREQRKGCPQGSCSPLEPCSQQRIEHSLARERPRAYRTSPTAALQVLTGLPPLHLQLQQEVRYITLTRLHNPLPPEIIDIKPTQIEPKAKGWTLHPSLFLNPKQISMTNGGPESITDTGATHIFTDGSKTDDGVGAAYCVYNNKILTHQWKGQLHKHNTVFQAELTALKEAIQYASENLKNQQVKVYIDNQASLYAIANPKTKAQMVRQIFKHLIDSPNIQVSWIKAHVDYPGNEKADELAKEATTSGHPYPVLLPTTHIKTLLKTRLLKDWQELWKKGDTGRPVHKVLPKVSLYAQNW
ncbi:Putative protein in type-1 retrotransposable element R1DM [Araneus ventricosus]|uniref:RNase H type-1 domain-containing protein n=1 Tax=Araneus ventricosus TaxID=182803 RepID=A0A4Y2GJH5_ARAVE|nr:Putative protein in type-1 retrotransposable element R1DM [Araneus ventricosus]